jgi:hypothetical protein
MLRAYDMENGYDAAEQVIKNAREWAGHGTLPFYGAAASLLVEALEGMDSKRTGAAKTAALNRIYKSACCMTRKGFDGVFPSAGRWALCDGYRFVRLNVKPESYPERENTIDLEQAIPEASRYSEAVELPTVAEIKAHLADVKARFGRKWRNYSDSHIEALPGWWCNPDYLLDMVQALPGGTAHLPKNSISPLYYESPDGDALLLPCRHPVTAAAAA